MDLVFLVVHNLIVYGQSETIVPGNLWDQPVIRAHLLVKIIVSSNSYGLFWYNFFYYGI